MSNPRYTVVYAEDDEPVRASITELLTMKGFDVHACEDGDEAVSLFEQMAPDAVLLDLNLPQVNGLEVARRLRAMPIDKPWRLVAMTGQGGAELRRKATDAGFDAFLTKPVTGDELAAALRPR